MDTNLTYTEGLILYPKPNANGGCTRDFFACLTDLVPLTNESSLLVRSQNNYAPSLGTVIVPSQSVRQIRLVRRRQTAADPDVHRFVFQH